MKKYKYILFILVLTSSPLTFGEFIPRNYYFCEDETGGSVLGVFGIQQIDGTYSDPYVYDPKQPSREYIRFLNSSYPIPLGFAPIISETEKEIFLQGTHFAYRSQSKMDEFFVVVINKENLSMKGRILNYKGEVFSFKSKCSDNVNDIRK